MDGSEGRFEKIFIFDFMMESNTLEKLKDLDRDLEEKPAMVLLMRGFFKDEEWIDYLSMKINTDEMVEEFKKRLSRHFEVLDVIKIGPFDLASIVDFKDHFPNEEELKNMMTNLEVDIVDFLMSEKYLGKIKEQIDIFADPFKSLVDFSIGHSFLRKADEDGLITAINVAFKDAEVQKKVKVDKLSEELLRILDRHDLESYFQPIVDLKEKRVVAYEALIRGPEGSLLRNPEILFKVAASSGLELELDKLARRKHLEKFKESGIRDAYITINLGPTTPLFIDEIEKDMRKYDIPPESVIWEISERTYVDDFAAFLRVVDFLTSKGYRVAVDDFGSGATTFKLTFSLKSHFIKIDKGIVRNVHENENKRFLLYKMIQCFYKPDNALVIEGVETEDELKSLIKIGYRYYQGFYFFKPSPKIPSEEEVKEKLASVETSSTKIFNAYYEF